MNFNQILNYGKVDSYFSIFFYLISIIFILLMIFINIKEKKNQLIIILGILIRAGIIFSDNFFKMLSFSGSDAIAFHFAGISYVENNNHIFTKFPFILTLVGPIYKMTKIYSPMIIQCINLILYFFTILILYKFMKGRTKNKKLITEILFLLNFSLVSALLNISMLREMLMVFLITLGIYCFFKWVAKENLINLMEFISLILLAAFQHTGVIFLIVLPLIYKVLEKKRMKKFLIITTIIILGVIIIPYIMKIGYLSRGLQLEERMRIQGIDSGNSSYVKPISSIKEMFLSFPIRYIYFSFSPLPHQFRGTLDIMSFLFNSCIYIYINFNIIKEYKKSIKIFKNKIIIKTLILGYILCNFVYALGTETSGTALRHRDKLYTLLLIIFFLVKETSNRIKIRKGKNEKYFNCSRKKSLFT